jgi:N-acetyl-gamma-glutamylphosphate reductase
VYLLVFHAHINEMHGSRSQLAPADFFLFPHLKSIMKGTCFADVAAIQERVTAFLRSIPKEAFADSFQKLYERCQQCVVKNGEYFDGQ